MSTADLREASKDRRGKRGLEVEGLRGGGVRLESWVEVRAWEPVGAGSGPTMRY